MSVFSSWPPPQRPIRVLTPHFSYYTIRVSIACPLPPSSSDYPDRKAAFRLPPRADPHFHTQPTLLILPTLHFLIPSRCRFARAYNNMCQSFTTKLFKCSCLLLKQSYGTNIHIILWNVYACVCAFAMGKKQTLFHALVYIDTEMPIVVLLLHIHIHYVLCCIFIWLRVFIYTKTYCFSVEAVPDGIVNVQIWFWKLQLPWNSHLKEILLI